VSRNSTLANERRRPASSPNGTELPAGTVVARISRRQQLEVSLADAGGTVGIQVARDDAELISLARDLALLGQLRCIVWETSVDQPCRWPTVRSAIHLGRHVPTVLRTDLTRRAVRDIHELARYSVENALNWRVSVIGLDTLADDVNAAVDWMSPCDAHTVILSHAASFLTGRSFEILAGATMLGRRRVSVTDLAVACHTTERTLRARLQQSQLPSPNELLGWILLLHSVWRLERLGLSPKQAAYVAGYGGIAPWAALSEHVFRRVRRRTRSVADSEVFEGLFCQFERLLKNSERAPS
jgi:hypothetical protein